MRLLALFHVGFALTSALLYAFTGHPLWSSENMDFGRAWLLMVFHMAAVGSFIYILETNH